MIRVLGSEVTIKKCSSSPVMVGVKGLVALESMRTLTVLGANSRKFKIAKKGTVLELTRTGDLIIGDEMQGRLEERIAKGAEL